MGRLHAVVSVCEALGGGRFVVLLDGAPATFRPLARRGADRGAAWPLGGAGLGRRLVVAVESGGGVDDPSGPAPQGFAGSAGEGSEAAESEVAAGSHERQPSVEVDVQAVEDGREVLGCFPTLAPP